MELSIQLRQKRILSKRQQQSVEILQMNALVLSEYVKEAVEENPLLEWEENAERYVSCSGHGNREAIPYGKTEGESLHSFLLFQINTKKIPKAHKAVLHFLAESITENGYLEKDTIAIMMEKYAMQEKTAVRILSEFQQLEPVGVGARDIRECLLIQLRRKNASVLALRLAEGHLEEVAKKRLGHLAKVEGVTIEEIAAAIEEVRSCNPRPGSGFAGEGAVEYILPDILVERKGKKLILVINGGGIPGLRLNQDYKGLLRENIDAQTEQYLAEKQKQAEWLLQSMQRRESTLRLIAEIVVRKQRNFFMENDGDIAPLRMADVAEEADIHVSTVSRGVKGKYLQCERGMFPLRFFFSQSMESKEGIVSAENIKERIRALITAENKEAPFSDRVLTERLTDEGIRISRRTVTKYREMLGIRTAAGRKRY